jgi:hypothetical protein
LNFALEYAIRKVQETQVGLKLNEIHQLLAYPDDVNLLGDNTDTINKNTLYLILVKQIGVEILLEETDVSFRLAVSSPECRATSAHNNSKQII